MVLKAFLLIMLAICNTTFGLKAMTKNRRDAFEAIMNRQQEIILQLRDKLEVNQRLLQELRSVSVDEAFNERFKLSERFKGEYLWCEGISQYWMYEVAQDLADSFRQAYRRKGKDEDEAEIAALSSQLKAIYDKASQLHSELMGFLRNNIQGKQLNKYRSL